MKPGLKKEYKKVGICVGHEKRKLLYIHMPIEIFVEVVEKLL